MAGLLTGNTPAKEWLAQERLRMRIERRFNARWRQEIERASREMLAEAMDSQGAAPGAPVRFVADLREVYEAETLVAVRAFGGRLLEPGKGWAALETKDFAEFFMRLASEYVANEAIRQRIVAVAETTRLHIVRMLARGQEAGEPLDTIARSITRSIPRISRIRAATIARTETHGAANYGAHHAAMATGLRLQRQWIAVQDHRTRDFREPDISDFSHRAINGQTVSQDQPFQVPRLFGGSEPMMFPGDPEGSPGNVINCRCAQGHVIEE